MKKKKHENVASVAQLLLSIQVKSTHIHSITGDRIKKASEWEKNKKKKKKIAIKYSNNNNEIPKS